MALRYMTQKDVFKLIVTRFCHLEDNIDVAKLFNGFFAKPGEKMVLDSDNDFVLTMYDECGQEVGPPDSD